MFHQQYNTVIIDKNGQHQSSFTAAVEETFELYVNNARIASILASPAQLEQLADELKKNSYGAYLYRLLRKGV